jgi:drug/metabolite transporter (DMT)-like permease
VRMPDPTTKAAATGDVGAKLMLVMLCLIWGITWPLMKIALVEIPPLSMRTLAAGVGAITLFGFCRARGCSFYVPNAKTWAHIVIGAVLNIVAFAVLTAFAQMAAATSRVAIVTYTMPIWALVLAWLVLGERPTRIQSLAVGLCLLGLGILIEPLTTTGIPIGLVLALCTGVCWAMGLVYLRWAQIDADPMGVASLQLTIAFLIIAACLFAFEGWFHLGNAHAGALLATLFTGIGGNAIAYGLWFAIVRRLPAATASLGVLGSPVIGVVSSIIILGDRPTVTDGLGFALILAASACVLLTRPQPPEEVTA